MRTKISELKTKEYSANGKIVSFNEPQIMAIVNVTPDSFYDGGKYGDLNDIYFDVDEKISNGAHIIDIGAASSRPNAVEIDEEQEWKRLGPVLSGLRKRFPDILLSIDTFRASVARKAAGEGADIINDIGGGNLDPDMFSTIATLQLPYVLMHIKGTPQTMQKDPSYQNVSQEVRNGLMEKAELLAKKDFHKIILDPGFGFGKTTAHNYQLLKDLGSLAQAGYPVLAGVSRKGMINKVIGTSPVTALNGTTVLNTIALLNGAKFLRVHDVIEAKQAIELVKFYNNPSA
jgi:dihydropteroate synthase